MKCTLIIEDEVNVKFVGLTPETRRKLVKSVEYRVPGAQFSPAVRLGRWSGFDSFFNLSGRSYLNLLDKFLPIIDDDGYTVEIEDNRRPGVFEFSAIDKDSYSHVIWPEGHVRAGECVTLREHQVDMVNAFLNDPQSINVCPTSGGKTIVLVILSEKVQKYGRSIVIVPSKDLVTQTEKDYINFGLDVGVMFGDRKDIGKTHTICTWQTLEAMNKRKDGSLESFLEGVVCVICDECHLGKANIIKSLLSGPCSNTPIRWGLTGTLPSEAHDKMTLLSTIGPVCNTIKATELQDMGYMANLHVHIKQLVDIGPAFPDYAGEYKWLTTSTQRLTQIASMLPPITSTGNTLILVNNIATGNALCSLIPGAIFLNGSVKSVDRLKEYKTVQSTSNVTLICTFGIASTGLDLPHLDNLILLEAGKAFTRVIQSIGRVLRITNDKVFANVYDICSTYKYSKKHLTQRKAYYKEAGYPFSIAKVNY